MESSLGVFAPARRHWSCSFGVRQWTRVRGGHSGCGSLAPAAHTSSLESLKLRLTWRVNSTYLYWVQLRLTGFLWQFQIGTRLPPLSCLEQNDVSDSLGTQWPTSCQMTYRQFVQVANQTLTSESEWQEGGQCHQGDSHLRVSWGWSMFCCWESHKKTGHWCWPQPIWLDIQSAAGFKCGGGMVDVTTVDW